jgi:hypothetical protein
MTMTTPENQPLLEICGLCEALFPSSEMVDIYVCSPKGQPLPMRFCRRCASPRLTYIAGHLRLTRVDVPRLLGLAFGLTVAVLNIAFGYVIATQLGSPLGLWVALTGVLCGAGISLAFAVSIAMPHGVEV